jgi:hypothetical protein
LKEAKGEAQLQDCCVKNRVVIRRRWQQDVSGNILEVKILRKAYGLLRKVWGHYPDNTCDNNEKAKRDKADPVCNRRLSSFATCHVHPNDTLSKTTFKIIAFQ